jgi:hypothetical protein
MMTSIANATAGARAADTSGLSRPQPAEIPAPVDIVQPHDPGIIDASIPTFFVGRGPDGFWLARGRRPTVDY